MSDPLFVPAGDVRRLWLFTLDLAEGELSTFDKEQFDEAGHSLGWGLRDALGVSRIDPNYVEVFKAETMADYGLDTYLIEAHGMAAEQVALDADKLKSLIGPVVVVLSKAFGGRTAHFNLSDDLKLVGRYSAEPMTIPIEPLRSKSAEGVLSGGKAKPSDAAMSGRIATLVLLVLFALVGAMIWIGG